MTATARDQLVEGVALLVWLQAREARHHALQPHREGLAQINHLLLSINQLYLVGTML